MKAKLLVSVKLAFPFRLSMPNSAFLVNHCGKRYSVRAKPGRAKHVFEYGAPSPEASKWEWLEARFAKGKPGVKNRAIGFTNDPGHFLAKVVDHGGFTFIDVMFEIPLPNPRKNERRLDAIATEGFLVARHFIDVYREVTNESDVFHPAIEHSPGVEIHLADKYEMNDEGVEATFTRISRTIRWNLQHATGVTKPTELSGSVEKRFAERLRQGDDVPIHMEFLLDAKDYSIVQRNHRMALLALGSAFEVFLQRRLLEECAIRGVAELPTSGGASPRMKPATDAIDGGSLKAHLIELHCRFLCGHSVKSCKEYQRWDTKCTAPGFLDKWPA